MEVAPDADEGAALEVRDAPVGRSGGRELVGPRPVVAGGARMGVVLADQRLLAGAEGAEGGALLIGPGARRRACGREAALDVEDRVGMVPLHVQPDGIRRLDRGRRHGRLGHVVDVVGDPDVVGCGDLVVHHVEQLPVVGAAHRHAVALGRAEDRLLLTRGEEGAVAVVVELDGGGLGPDLAPAAELAAEGEPDGVVEVDLLDGRHRAVGLQEIGAEAHDVAVVGRLLDGDRGQQDVVLAGPDVDGPVGEPQALAGGAVPGIGVVARRVVVGLGRARLGGHRAGEVGLGRGRRGGGSGQAGEEGGRHGHRNHHQPETGTTRTGHPSPPSVDPPIFAIPGRNSSLSPQKPQKPSGLTR